MLDLEIPMNFIAAMNADKADRKDTYFSVDEFASLISSDQAMTIYNYQLVPQARIIILCDINECVGKTVYDNITDLHRFKKFDFTVWDGLDILRHDKFGFERTIIEPFLEKNKLNINSTTALQVGKYEELRNEFLQYLVLSTYLKGPGSDKLIISGADIIKYIIGSKTVIPALDDIGIVWDTWVNIFTLVPVVIVYNGFDLMLEKALTNDTIVDQTGKIGSIDTTVIGKLIDQYRRFQISRTEWHQTMKDLNITNTGFRGGKNDN